MTIRKILRNLILNLIHILLFLQWTSQLEVEAGPPCPGGYHFSFKVQRSNRTYQIYPEKGEYSIEHFLDIAQGQTNFIVDAWRIGFAVSNPSVTRDPRNGSRLMYIYRDVLKGNNGRIAFTMLDAKHWKELPGYRNYIGHYYPPKIQEEFSGEDVRIFTHNYDYYLSYNFREDKNVFYSARVHLHPIHHTFYVYNTSILLKYQNEYKVRNEKNWMSFEYCKGCLFENGQLSPKLFPQESSEEDGNTISFAPKQHQQLNHVEREHAKHNEDYTHIQKANLFWVYHIQPHIIVRPYRVRPDDPHELTAEVAFITEVNDIYWPWGDLRGGSPALPINEESYLTFFHTRGCFTHHGIITYVMGAYLFERNPPFRMTHLSPEPIVDQTFVNETFGWTYKAVDYVIYPMGFIFDDDYIYVSYGKNDRQGWVLKLKKTEFLNFLKPVNSTVIGTSEMNEMNTDIIRGTFRYLPGVTSHYNFSLPSL